MKHNSVLPNARHRKEWRKYVKTNFDQPGQKKSRALKRSAKIIKGGICSYNKLRPIVVCPSHKHNLRKRSGRGFTLAELKAAKLTVPAAGQIGISVDRRRRSRNQKAVSRNLNRLVQYVKNVVVFPRGKECKKGVGGLPADSPTEGYTSLAPVDLRKVAPAFKSMKKTLGLQYGTITESEAKVSSFQRLRQAIRGAKFHGQMLKKRLEAARAV